MNQEDLEYLVNLQPNQLQVLLALSRNLDFAIRKHNNMNSYHEGYAVILKELDELWDEIKCQTPDKWLVKKEAYHVAAMGLRFVFDLCGE